MIAHIRTSEGWRPMMRIKPLSYDEWERRRIVESFRQVTTRDRAGGDLADDERRADILA